MQECPEHWPDRPDSCGRIRVRSASASVSMSVGWSPPYKVQDSSP